jgi:hypothetical protein
MSRDERFVFVVCGDASHLATLDLALRHLRKFAPNPIVVVTDRRRNAAPIAHDLVVDCATPEALSDAQAAIHLKTSLHRRLDPRHLYCYLDTDVLAARAGVDQVFMYRFGPVTFASDHCRMRYFSPWAVDCGCLSAERLARAEELNALIERFDACPPELQEKKRRMLATMRAHARRHDSPEPRLGAERDALRRRLAPTAGRPWRRRAELAAFVLPRHGSALTRRLWRQAGAGLDPADEANLLIDEAMGTLPDYVRRETGFDWRWQERRGYDEAGRHIVTDVPYHVESVSDFRFDTAGDAWLDASGERVFHGPCDHLREALADEFGIVVADPDWQHWNGGVFLFDARQESESSAFLDSWHELTVRSFDRARFKTRDQGTLIAAAWRHGLEHQATLPKVFNFLADYHKPGLLFDAEHGFSFEGRAGHLRPFLVHVYHHWGDREWDVWRWLESRVEEGGE